MERTFEIKCARCGGIIHITTDQQDLVRNLQEAKVRIICPECNKPGASGTGKKQEILLAERKRLIRAIAMTYDPKVHGDYKEYKARAIIEGGDKNGLP